MKINYEIEDIKYELYYARKSEGVKLYRIINCPKISEILGRDCGFNKIKENLVKLIFEIDDENIPIILMCIYALADDYKQIPFLSKRRQLCCEKTGISIDKLLELENSGIIELSLMINRFKS